MTVSLTLAMRFIVLTDSDTTNNLNKYFNKYCNIVQETQIFYDHLLMRIGLNSDIFSEQRFANLGLNSGPGMQYATENNLASFEQYSDLRIQQTWQVIDDYSKRFFEHGDNSLLFIKPIYSYPLGAVAQLSQDKSTSFSYTWSAYNNLILMIRSMIYNLANQQNKNSFSASTDNIELNFMLRNTLQTFRMDIEVLEEQLTDLITSKLKLLKVTIYTIFFLNIGLMIMAMVVSIALITKIIKTFQSIFQSLEELRYEDLENRNEQLNYVVTLMEKEKLTPNHVAILMSSETNNRGFYKSATSKSSVKHRKKKTYQNDMSARVKALSSNRKVSTVLRRGVYFFTLLTSISVLGLFYVGQFVFSGILVGTYVSKVNKIEIIHQKNLDIFYIFSHITEYRNSLLHLSLIDNEPSLKSVYLSKFNRLETRSNSDLSNKINTLLANFDLKETGTEGAVKSIYNSMLTSNLCELVPQYTDKKFLCASLDVQIPEKGLISACFKILSVFHQIADQLMAGSQSSARSIMLTSQFVSFEYAYSNIYLSSLQYLMNRLCESVDILFIEQIDNLKQLITIMMCFLIALSTSFTVVTFKNIFKVRDEMSFSYQVVPLEGVVDNQRVKVTFLRLYRLDNQYFS